MWAVAYLPDAEQERDKLPGAERAAIYNAVRKLEALGPDLPFPHSSEVKGATDLRELRPRRGRSAWRPLYRRVAHMFVIAAVGPEAESNPRGFRKACERAEQRLAELQEE